MTVPRSAGSAALPGMRRRLGADGLRAVPATAGGARGLDGQLFEVITAQLREKAITIKTGTLVEATIIASASKDDDEGRWVEAQGEARHPRLQGAYRCRCRYGAGREDPGDAGQRQ